MIALSKTPGRSSVGREKVERSLKKQTGGSNYDKGPGKNKNQKTQGNLLHGFTRCRRGYHHGGF